MRKLLRWLALIVLVAGTVTWLVTGAHRGWTKTSVAKGIPDEVTGLVQIAYEKRFVPGVDFLGAVVLTAAVLAAVSFAFRRPGSGVSTPAQSPTNSNAHSQTKP